MSLSMLRSLLFFFTPTPTSELYTLSLHDALPISSANVVPDTTGPNVIAGFGDPIPNHLWIVFDEMVDPAKAGDPTRYTLDRKSTRLNSSHVRISYAVFCLKKKKKSN